MILLLAVSTCMPFTSRLERLVCLECINDIFWNITVRKVIWILREYYMYFAFCLKINSNLLRCSWCSWKIRSGNVCLLWRAATFKTSPIGGNWMDGQAEGHTCYMRWHLWFLRRSAWKIWNLQGILKVLPGIQRKTHTFVCVIRLQLNCCTTDLDTIFFFKCTAKFTHLLWLNI